MGELFWNLLQDHLCNTYVPGASDSTTSRPLKNYEASVAETPETASLAEQK